MGLGFRARATIWVTGVIDLLNPRDPPSRAWDLRLSAWGERLSLGFGLRALGLGSLNPKP